MNAKWSHILIGSIAMAFAASFTACEPVTIQQGPGGNGGGGQGSGSSSASSSSGSTGGGGGASVACDPMNFPAEGSPCAKEGDFCSSGCEDPCMFCNVMNCTNGVWTRVEVFPAPCLSCEEVCVPVVAAQCAGGPPDQAACVQGCNQNQMGACKIAFNQMLACIGPSPTFTCDVMTRPTVAGCEMQFEKLYMCIMP